MHCGFSTFQRLEEIASKVCSGQMTNRVEREFLDDFLNNFPDDLLPIRRQSIQTLGIPSLLSGVLMLSN